MTVNTEQLLFILENTPAEQNIMLQGKHGIGKSQILEKFFSEKNQKVVTLFLGQMSDPGDLIGLPEKNQQTGKTDFMLPYWFPTDNEPIVLFLDELNRARPEVLQTVMDLTLNRKLAGKSLPKGSRIISAVNSGGEYQLTDLDPALVSRFNIYTFEPSVEDWLNWAKGKIDERIINFIFENPESLDSAENEIQTEDLQRFPDRRSWVRASRIIENVKELTELHKILISGILGDTVTASFFKFTEQNKIPSAKEILSDFENALKKIECLEKSFLTGINESIFRFLENQKSLTDKNTVSENLEKYFDYLSSLSKEFQAHFVSLCSASFFPKTLCFIAENSRSLYEKIINSAF